MRQKIFFFFAILLAATVMASGQNFEGFEEALIVKKDGDSLKCFIELLPGYGSTVPIRHSDGTFGTVRSKEIRYILTSNRYIQNVQYDGKKELLMTLVADGRASLFLHVVMTSNIRFARYGTPVQARVPVLVYVLKKGAIYTEVKRNRYNEILGALLFDCVEVVQKLRANVYSYEEVDKAVNEYNACK